MTQMMIPNEMQVRIDYECNDLPDLIKQLRPVIWEEGSGYCCLLGPDCKKGVLGYGKSVIEAVTDWELQVKERMACYKSGDEVTGFIMKALNGTLSPATIKRPIAA